jgi:hypothetical protein
MSRKIFKEISYVVSRFLHGDPRRHRKTQGRDHTLGSPCRRQPGERNDSSSKIMQGSVPGKRKRKEKLQLVLGIRRTPLVDFVRRSCTNVPKAWLRDITAYERKINLRQFINYIEVPDNFMFGQTDCSKISSWCWRVPASDSHQFKFSQSHLRRIIPSSYDLQPSETDVQTVLPRLLSVTPLLWIAVEFAFVLPYHAASRKWCLPHGIIRSIPTLSQISI